MMMTTTMRRMRMMERAVGGAKSERRSLFLVSLAMAVVLFGTLVLSAEEDDGGSAAKLLGDPGYGRPGPYPISRVLKRSFSVPNATTGCRQGSTDLCPQTVNLFFPTVAKLSRSPDRSHCGDLNRVAGEGVGESAFRGLSLLCDDGEREEREEREDGEGGEVLGEAAAAAAAAAGAGAGACADAGAAAAIAAAAATSGFPLAIFSPGFMLSADLYFGYGEILASWGYVVVVWEPNTESVLNYLTHRNRALVAIALIDWAFNQSQNVPSSPIYQKIDPSKGVFAAGHSAGGKTSALAAQFDKAQRILGVVGVDPVDCSPPFQSVGPSFPSSLPNLAQSKALKAWIGSEFGQSCAPAECNYQKFFTADRVPSWQVLILKSGHMSFCNGTVGLPGLACKKGTVSVKVAIELSSTVLVALAEASIRNADIKQFMKDWCTSQSLQVTCLSK